jgi:hypothetical protein
LIAVDHDGLYARPGRYRDVREAPPECNRLVWYGPRAFGKYEKIAALVDGFDASPEQRVGFEIVPDEVRPPHDAA